MHKKKKKKKGIILTLVLLLIGIRVPHILETWFPFENDIVFCYIQYTLSCVFAFTVILYVCKIIIDFLILGSGGNRH